MGRYCSDCTYLNTEKSKGSGCYMCNKKGKNMMGNQPCCPSFEMAYARSSAEKEKIYDDAKEAANKTDGKPAPILLAIVLIIILILGKIFGFVK